MIRRYHMVALIFVFFWGGGGRSVGVCVEQMAAVWLGMRRAQ